MNDLLRTDPAVHAIIQRETERQNHNFELIASENFASAAVMEAAGSTLTNKYAEGYPGRRYYGGCEVVDEVEDLARERAKTLYGADWVNVQPHSGATANAAVYLTFMKPGETLLGLDLAHEELVGGEVSLVAAFEQEVVEPLLGVVAALLRPGLAELEGRWGAGQEPEQERGGQEERQGRGDNAASVRHITFPYPLELQRVRS